MQRCSLSAPKALVNSAKADAIFCFPRPPKTEGNAFAEITKTKKTRHAVEKLIKIHDEVLLSWNTHARIKKTNN